MRERPVEMTAAQVKGLLLSGLGASDRAEPGETGLKADLRRLSDDNPILNQLTAILSRYDWDGACFTNRPLSGKEWPPEREWFCETNAWMFASEDDFDTAEAGLSGIINGLFNVFVMELRERFTERFGWENWYSIPEATREGVDKIIVAKAHRDTCGLFRLPD